MVTITLYYPDISDFQRGIDLAGAKAVCIKATEGISYFSPDYSRARANAAKHGAFAFAYHFLHSGSAASQAAWCHKGKAGTGWTGTGQTALMLDIEPTGTSRPNLNDALSFIKAYRDGGGVIHLAYFPHWYWQQLGSPSLTQLSSLSVALVSSAYTTYTDASTGTGWVPYGGVKPAIWQYTDKLHFGGRDIDFNAFRGTHGGDQSGAAVTETLAQLKALATTGKIPAHKPPVRAPVPPERREAKGNESLRHALNREGTTIARGLWLMAHHHDGGNFGHPLQAAYIARGNWDAIMKPGMPYWVG